MALGGASVALLIGVGFFFAPFGASSDLASRGAAAAALVSSFAVVLSALALAATVSVESSDFRAEERVKEDVARLLASMRSIYLKCAWLTQQSDKSEERYSSLFDDERGVVQDFLCSTTAPAFYAFEGRMSVAAGSQPEEWRVASLYMIEILGAKVPGEYRLIANRAVRLERLIADLRRDDIATMSAAVADLSRAIAEFKTVRDNTTLARAAYDVFGGEDHPEANVTAGVAELENLKRRGVEDPDMDLWLGVHANDVKVVQAAIEAGANVNVTLGEILDRHRDTQG